MTHLLLVFLCPLAMGALALATERHQEDIFGAPLAARTTARLRAAGWSTLALALWAVVAREGWGLGLVIYSGHTSLAAGLVYVALILRGRLGSG